MKDSSRGLLELFIDYGYYPIQVMRSLIAVIALISQLQWLPGAFVCMRQQAATDPCSVTMPNGPAVAAGSQTDGGPGCAVLGPCAVVSPAVLPSAQVAFVGGIVSVGAPSVLARFSGYVVSPLSPPPQA